MSSMKEGYKLTELGEIPEDWQLKTFGDVMNGFSSGQTPSRAIPEYYKGDIHWITSGELNYNVISDTIEKITAEAVRRTNLKILPKGTFLIAITGLEAEGTRGSCGIVGEEATTNQSCMALYPKKELDNDYLRHFYVKYGNWLAFKYCQGTKQQSYTAKIAKLLPIAIPPSLDEQKKIANTLTDTDTLIESIEKVISKKRLIKAGIMQKLFKPNKHWKIKKLGEIASIQRGASPRPIESPKWFDAGSTVGWVRISDVTKSVKYLNNTVQQLSEDGIRNSRFVKRGKLIMSICATVGRPIITNMDVCIHDGFVVFNKLRIDQEYLYNFLTYIEPDWSNNGQTGSQMNLNTNLINSTFIPFPSDMIEQKRIAQIISDIDAEIQALTVKLNKYKTLKHGIMHDLLTGKKRLTIQK
jgi:type I restriction enzyme, S subunit